MYVSFCYCLRQHFCRVTLTFDLLTPKVDTLIPQPHGPLVPTSVYPFSNTVFTSSTRVGFL